MMTSQETMYTGFYPSILSLDIDDANADIFVVYSYGMSALNIRRAEQQTFGNKVWTWDRPVVSPIDVLNSARDVKTTNMNMRFRTLRSIAFLPDHAPKSSTFYYAAPLHTHSIPILIFPWNENTERACSAITTIFTIMNTDQRMAVSDIIQKIPSIDFLGRLFISRMTRYKVISTYAETQFYNDHPRTFKSSRVPFGTIRGEIMDG